MAGDIVRVTSKGQMTIQSTSGALSESQPGMY